MTPYKLGWKVVNFEDGKYISSLSHSIAQQTEYFIGKPTMPLDGCGPLCVFKKRKDAEDFCAEWEDVFPCAYIPSKEKKIWNRYFATSVKELTPGKALASEVILLKERRIK